MSPWPSYCLFVGRVQPMMHSTGSFADTQCGSCLFYTSSGAPRKSTCETVGLVLPRMSESSGALVHACSVHCRWFVVRHTMKQNWFANFWQFNHSTRAETGISIFLSLVRLLWLQLRIFFMLYALSIHILLTLWAHLFLNRDCDWWAVLPLVYHSLIFQAHVWKEARICQLVRPGLSLLASSFVFHCTEIRPKGLSDLC